MRRAPFDGVDGNWLLLSAIPPGSRQVRSAAAVVLLLLLTLAVTAPFATIPVPGSQAFLPAYAMAVLINDLITSVLLFTMFAIQRSRALLLLAIGYLFAALTAAPWALTFPGVFPALGPLNEGVQVTAWIAAIRRLGFPVFVLAYVLAKEAPPLPGPHRSAQGVVAASVAGTVAATIGMTWFLVAAEAALPRFMNDARQTTGLWIYVPVLATALGIVTLALLLRRLRSVLDLWLVVVLLTFLVELLLLSFLSSGRFSVGWWSGRFFGLVSATIVLIVLLAETTALHAQLARALATERREREARLSTMEALSASIAHEVNQPLASMVTNADAGIRWLEKSQPDLAEARAALRRIVSDGHRAGEVVRGIRSLFGSNRRQHGPFDVNAAIRDALAGTAAEAKLARVEVETDLDRDLPPAVGDGVQIRQVVANLVCNAIQAMGDAADADRVVRVRSDADRLGSILVCVEDGGTGLDGSLRERIFEPFFTTKAQGMGLGLMFCRSVVEAHGGRLWVTENAPRGAVFRFSLPAALPAPAATAAGEPA